MSPYGGADISPLSSERNRRGLAHGTPATLYGMKRQTTHIIVIDTCSCWSGLITLLSTSYYLHGDLQEKAWPGGSGLESLGMGKSAQESEA